MKNTPSAKLEATTQTRMSGGSRWRRYGVPEAGESGEAQQNYAVVEGHAWRLRPSLTLNQQKM